jgi:hypothetical protein
MRHVDLIVMHGQEGSGEAQRMVDGARRAIAQDLVDRAIAADAFARIIVSTNDLTLARSLGALDVIVEIDPPEKAFHFGIYLRQLVLKHSVDRLVYLGGGCAPLLTVSTLSEMAERVRQSDCLFLTNNFYSVDFCAFVPAKALLSVPLPDRDNSLGWLLSQDAGLPAEELPRTTATSFDVDTPTDIMVLAMHPDVPLHTRAYLDSLILDVEHVTAASAVFLDRQAEALVSGRVNSRLMAYLERETVCRTRVFSEERGMRADGRLARGEVRSVLGMYMENVGMERFFQDVIPQLGQAAFLDDRVLWAHHGVWPASNDRFNSDLLRPGRVVDPFVRRFTEAALLCPVPVVLGGHSLVSGGLCVLVEAAWAHGGVDIRRPLGSL